MKDLLATAARLTGVMVFVLWVFGALDFGNFRIYYGPGEPTCTSSSH